MLIGIALFCCLSLTIISTFLLLSVINTDVNDTIIKIILIGFYIGAFGVLLISLGMGFFTNSIGDFYVKTR